MHLILRPLDTSSRLVLRSVVPLLGAMLVLCLLVIALDHLLGFPYVTPGIVFIILVWVLLLVLLMPPLLVLVLDLLLHCFGLLLLVCGLIVLAFVKLLRGVALVGSSLSGAS